MQAIEFDAVVQDQAILLPSPAVLPSGQTVRVIVMYEPRDQTDQGALGDQILDLARRPRVLPRFAPLARDEAHER